MDARKLQVGPTVRAANIKAGGDQLLAATAFYILGLIPVLFGVWFGVDYLQPRNYHDFPGFMITQPDPRGGVLQACANWDGVWYTDIARDGYKYSPDEGSYVVFFPMYPCLGRAVAKAVGVSEQTALLIVAHVALILAILVLQKYVALRFSGSTLAVSDGSVLCLLLLPASFFFRMAYAESLFLLWVLLVLYGMERRWSLALIACLAGAASGTRAVGIAILPVFLWHLWREAHCDGSSLSGRLARFAGACVWLAPLASWGLLAFMAFLWREFGDPFVFSSNHSIFNWRAHTPFTAKLINLVTLEPFWSPYVGASGLHTHESVANPLLTLRFVNPLYFAGTALLIMLGAAKRWLNGRELLLSALLLGVSYVTKGHDNGMLGMARYASVVAPVYLVCGRLFGQAPESLRVMPLAITTLLLGLYSALFAAWYVFV